METVTRNVEDMNEADRLALEHVLGRSLREDQQLVIRVISPPGVQEFSSTSNQGTLNTAPALPEWCNVYAGLSNEEIADVEQSILRRADLN